MNHEAVSKPGWRGNFVPGETAFYTTSWLVKAKRMFKNLPLWRTKDHEGRIKLVNLGLCVPLCALVVYIFLEFHTLYPVLQS
jgi:hypothetical protein